MSFTKSKSTVQCRKEADVVGRIRLILVRFDDMADGKTVQRQKSRFACRPKVSTQTSTFKHIAGKHVDRLLTRSDAWKLCKALKYHWNCQTLLSRWDREKKITIFEIKRFKYITTIIEHDFISTSCDICNRESQNSNILHFIVDKGKICPVENRLIFYSHIIDLYMRMIMMLHQW